MNIGHTIRRFLQAFVCVLAALNSAHGQLQTAWTQIYHPAVGAQPRKLVVDAQGNACVLADMFGGFAVLKYSRTGTPLWTNRYDSMLRDAPGGLAVDPNGAVCVSMVSATNWLPGILHLFKYESDGSFAWSHSEDVIDALPNASHAVATDSAGNILVAAITTSGYSVLKYGADGTPLWTNVYWIASGYFPATRYFDVDPAGNVALVASLSHLGKDQMLVVKYSPSGLATSWVHEWAGSNDFLTATTFDSGGNLCVAASVVPPGSYSYHVFAAKYDPAGSLVWSHARPPANGHHAVSRQLALDSAGNLILTAYETRPVSEDEDETQTLTLKYSASGARLWAARAAGFQRSPTGLAVDGADNIFVLGSDSRSAPAAFLVEYRPNGSQAAELLLPDRSSFGHLAAGAPGEVYLSEVDLNLSWAIETRKLSRVETPSPISATIVPALAEVLPGSSVTFTAAVSGVGPFTYDWRYFGYRMGGTNATFTITNAQYEWRSHGDYTVIVSNATDYTVSPEARLTVLRPPSVQLTRQGGQVFIEWRGAQGWKLQRSKSLSAPQWTDVPGSEGVSQIQLPLEAFNQFFRLAK